MSFRRVFASWTTAIWRICLVAGWLGVFALPSAGLADPVTVRGGEHPGFSRLVVDFGAVPGWVVERDGPLRRIRFDGPPVRFDTSDAVARLGRTRIREVRTGISQIEIELGCACALQSYTLPGGRLVIDVSRGDGAAIVRTGVARPSVLNEAVSGGATPPAVVAEPPRSLRENAAWFDGLPDAVRVADGTIERRPRPEPVRYGARDAPPLSLTLPLRDLAGTRPARFDGSEHSSARSAAGPVRDTASLDLFTAHARQDSAAAAIAAGLDRALGQGAIDQTAGADRGDQAKAGGAPLPRADTPSLRVTTSVDDAFDTLAERFGPTGDPRCFGDRDLDIAAWGNREAATSRTAELRRALLGEFDAASAGAAADLAKHHIYLGFGAEARAVLTAYPVSEPDQFLLLLLADIADGRTRPSTDEIGDLLDCPGPAALWALLAVDAPDPTANIATDHIAAAFSALPLHLRRHYGPTLVERYLALGDPDAARRVWGAVDRAAGDHGERFVLVSADLAMAEGDLNTAEAAYDGLVDAGPAEAPLAVVRLLASQLARGAEVSPQTVETAAALAFENRGTGLSRELKLVELEARIALSQWDSVLRELPRARFGGSLTAGDETQLTAAFFSALAERASAVDFLAWAFEARGLLDAAEAGDEARRAVARRFLSLGLSQPARDLLDDIASPEERDGLLWAEADIEAGDFTAALDRLGKRAGAEADALRARALTSLGRHGEASDAYANAGDDDGARRAAARAGAWADSEAMLQSAVKAVAGQSEDLPEAELARNAALIRQASSLRDDIAGLLSNVEALARQTRP